MTEGIAWKLETEDLQLKITVKGTEISDIRGGMVSFTRDELLGEACSRPVPITALGSIGENIVRTLKKTDGVGGIRISAHMLNVRVQTEHHMAVARKAIRQLMETHVCPSHTEKTVRRPLVRDIKVGMLSSPTRQVEYPPLVPAA